MELDGWICFPDSPQWPERLNDLGDAKPFCLWVQGILPTADQETVALVGARASTSYGNTVATDFAYDLANMGLCVISGGAYGIDAAAHRGAMEGTRDNTTAAPTVAVICGGLANLYPAGNTEMFKNIVRQGGAVVTEMPPSARPARWRFLARNRIIAAWSDALLVVEASTRSVAIGAALDAHRLGRNLGAVPGPITSMTSKGCHNMLSDGIARVVTSVRDIPGLTITE